MASQTDARYEKKRKSSRKFNISILKDVISRNKKTPVDKKESIGDRSRYDSEGLIHSPESSFCASPLCIDVSGIKTDHSASPPFSPSILGTKQIFTFDDLFPHIRKSPANNPLNTCSSIDHGIYSDSYDVPHDLQIFQQPFYQPIKLTNQQQTQPSRNVETTNQRNISRLEFENIPVSFSRGQFLPHLVSSISPSEPPPPPPPPRTFQPEEVSFPGREKWEDFEFPGIKLTDVTPPRKVLNEMTDGYDNLRSKRSSRMKSRLHSLNENHLVLHERGLLRGCFDPALLNCNIKDQVEITLGKRNTSWKVFGRRRSKKRDQNKQQDTFVRKTHDLARVQRSNPKCKYSSTSEDSLNFVTGPSDRIWCDNLPKNSNFPLDHPMIVVSDHQCETSECLEYSSSVSLNRTRQVERDSDFGFRDYDTCDDSDASDEEGGLDTSDVSSRNGGGLTSNLSLFSSCSTDEDRLIEDFKKYDSDQDNLIDNTKFAKLMREHNVVSEDLPPFAGELSDMIENNRFSLEIVLRVWKKIRRRDKELKDGDIYSRLKEKKRRLLLGSIDNMTTLLSSTAVSSNLCQMKSLSSNLFQSSLKQLNQKRNQNSFFNGKTFTRDPLPRTAFIEEENGNDEHQLQAAFSALKGEIVDLSTKLDSVSRERDIYEDTLASAQEIEVDNERKYRSKIDNLTQQYEERLTELHSVIAELTRKIDRNNDDIIVEEDEEDLEEIRRESRRSRKKKGDESKKSGSEYETTECSTSESVESEAIFEESERSQLTNTKLQTDASTSCEIDDRAVEAGECIADLDVTGCRVPNCSASNLGNDNGTEDAIACQGSSSAGNEDELKLMLEEKDCLRKALMVAQQNVSSQRAMLLAMSREREALKNKLKDFQKLQPAIPLFCPQISDAITIRGLRSSPLSMALNVPTSDSDSAKRRSPVCSPTPLDDHTNSDGDIQVICRLAERVRLKRAESGDLRVTGSELSSVGVYTTGVAEQLVAGLQEESDAQELFHALATAGGAFAPHERLKEYELEAERLHSRIDHLRAQNDVLGATLNESKAHCDQLALMTGRAEAQAGALKMGVIVLDQIQESYEVLSALHEAQIVILATTCRATGVNSLMELGGYQKSDEGRKMELLDELKRAQEQRRMAENVARHLLSRIDKDETKVMNGNAHLDATNGSDEIDVPIDQEEGMIRTCIKRLQDDRTKILSCFQTPCDLSSVEEYFPPKYPLTDEEAHKLDLENAVLMQELTAIREDRAELRAQVYLLEREKAGLELRIGTCEAQTTAYSVTIEHLKDELSQTKTATSQESTGDSGVESSSFETESLRREKLLKSRVEDLVVTLEKITKNSEARHRQSQEFIDDLKKANSALLTAVDRLKKKYTLRIKRMELQAANMVDRHSQQVKLLKHRIISLEEQVGKKQMSTSLQHSTTSDGF